MYKNLIQLVKSLAKHNFISPINIARLRYLYILHKWPHFKHPKDLNEKINYLKFYGNTSLWPKLSDKYAVRKYIEDLGLGEILVKLYGKWDSVDDIDWDKLPNQFVLQCNNGSGDVLVCHDKATLDIDKYKQYFDLMLHRKFGIINGEPHYMKIQPCIIAKELLNANTQPCGSTSLIDYKIWCFNGKPHSIFVVLNRSRESANCGIYDLNWQYRPEFLRFTNHLKRAEQKLPKPNNLDRMLDVASKLSAGFPEVRVDLYEVDGRVYFGELTFTSQGGCMDYFSQQYLNEAGSLVKIYK